VPVISFVETLGVDLEPTFRRSLFLKCEGFNFAGSIKLKAATEMVETAERDGMLTPGSVLVESSPDGISVMTWTWLPNACINRLVDKLHRESVTHKNS
jgi:N-(2-amino-2-carboxyethyl)-L-glutamate synthase